MPGGFGALEPVFDQAGAAWNVDPNLIRAVAMQESGGNTRARSKAGAQGLMQIIPETQKHLGVQDPHDPVQAIWGGAKYLAEGLDKEGTPEGALLYYHGGPGWRDAYGPESRGYVPGVGAKLQQIVAMQKGTRSNAAPQQAAPTPAAPKEAAANAAPNYDDFLKRTGAGEAEAPTTPEVAAKIEGSRETQGVSAGAPSHDDFLKRTGAVAQAPAAPSPVAAAPPPDPGPPMADPYGTPWIGEGSPTVAEGQAAAANALSGVTEDSLRARLAPAPGTTYGEVLPFAKDDATGAIRLALPGGVRNMLTGLLDLSQGPRTGTVTPEGTNALAGIVMGGMRSPAAGTGAAITEVAAQRAAAPRGAWTEEVPRFAPQPGSASERFAASEAAEGQGPSNLLPVAPEAGEAGAAQALPGMLPAPPRPGVTAEPLPAPGSAPVPNAANSQGELRAAGAQASTAAEAAMTPGQIKANRRQAEVSRAVTVPDGPNTRILVPGSEPTLAEHSFDPAIAQQETLLRQRNPNAFEGPEGRLTKNSRARVDFYEDMMGSDTRVQSMKEDRAAQGKKDIDAILANAKPVDATPALDAISGPLTDPRNMNRDAVQKNLAPMREKLFKADGSLKDDPNELWGIRDDIRDKIDSIGSDPTSTMKHVQSELIAYRDAIDGVLNQATGGHYQTFLDNWADASKPINEMELLQKNRLAMTDSKGNIVPGRFNKFVTDLAYKRGKAGIDPSMDITDVTMQKLLDLNDDLKRMGNIDLGKARGSPTNLFGTLAKSTGLGAVHAGIGAVAPVYGNMALQGAIEAVKPVLAQRSLNKLTNRHLSPPKNGYQQYGGPD